MCAQVALRRFLKRNKLACLVRAHEVQEAGYEAHFLATDDEGTEAKSGGEPPPGFGFEKGSRAPVITVFSAPNCE